MSSIEQLVQQALSLPSKSRVLIVERLLESLDFDSDPTILSLWTTAAKRRRDEVRDGSIATIPGDEALKQVRQLLGQ